MAIIQNSRSKVLSGSQKISAVIITKNAERTLGSCLDALRWVSEVIVLDSGSNDRTPDIASSKGVQFHVTNWHGFGRQKNMAIDLAQTEWILSIDADEFVSPELAAEISNLIHTKAESDIFEISRISKYCGKEMRHSGWYPDYVARLFRRGTARFSDSLVHERLVFSGEPERLRHHMMHDSFHSPDEVLDKVNRYSSLGAQQLKESGRTTSLTAAVLHGLGAFLKTYIVKAGFLDGAEGFLLAVSNGEGAYYKYVKLYYLNKQKR